MYPFDEQVFNSAKPIKYVYQKSKVDCEYLVVVLSGFNPKGAMPAYNYIRTLQNVDVNKLFILDDQGERGCYYLGENRVFTVEPSVVALITRIANQSNIPHQNIICCGSSKGGYASLYFGIKYGFGRIIVGAPQTYLGSYLNGAKEYPTLEFIAGGNNEESIQFLDHLLYQVVDETSKVPPICIHVGSGDHHYKGHVLPFQQYLQERGFDCELDVKDYNDHGDVRHYQTLMVERVIDAVPSLKHAARIMKVDVEQDGSLFRIIVDYRNASQFAFYVYRDGQRIETKWYTDNPIYEYAADGKGAYEFVAFAKNEEGQMVQQKTKLYTIN